MTRKIADPFKLEYINRLSASSPFTHCSGCGRFMDTREDMVKVSGKCGSGMVMCQACARQLLALLEKEKINGK